MTSFALNGKPVEVDVDPATPLLWVLRDSLGLTGTKFGCGMALCGACTVHLDGKAIRSCVAPVSRVEGKHVTTIEGLSPDSSHPLQRAWMEIDVPQCGKQARRSEEHTSELQSLAYLVCRLLLEKKKNN